MFSGIFRKISDKSRKWNKPLLFQLWIFTLVMGGFQLIWESYELELNDWFFFRQLSDGIGDFLLKITPPLLNTLFDLDISREENRIILPNGLNLHYWFYLSGIKQMCNVVILFIFVPGPAYKKLWYVPVTIALLFVTVTLRFAMLTIHCVIFPEHIRLIQDMLFGPLFYAEILVFWMAWVLLIARTASAKNEGKGISG